MQLAGDSVDLQQAFSAESKDQGVMVEAVGYRHFRWRTDPASGGEKRVGKGAGQLARSLKEDVVKGEGCW
ncbi:hypothetical protein RsS62_28450 [Rhizobium dioscoreae]|uniref:Uncharacterized protein n=1 Tax=Rhizobium dioscoreae TaxID=2653122 RepID=A0ABQ0Z0F6_9HYPH|nr:hypothetical protein RsS62_28450 [Rhizobium dioscoreae]GES49035.1 hypothetical protein RsS93_16490 [Rhizobium dioscoreae]GLU80478.1 hypothetical protein Rhsp01_16540 [Rhizobium sp. NBRC 114257]